MASLRRLLALALTLPAVSIAGFAQAPSSGTGSDVHVNVFTFSPELAHYTAAGGFEKSVTDPTKDKYVGFGLLPSGHWVTTYRQPQSGIVIFEPFSGNVVAEWTTPENAVPGDIGVRSDGTFVVIDQLNSKLYRYDVNGTWLNAPGWTIPGTGFPLGLGVDDQDHVWVAVPTTSMIEHLDANGAPVASLSVLEKPGDVAVAADGSLWMTARLTGELYHYSQAGALLGFFDTNLGPNFHGVACAADGTLWACSQDGGIVANFDTAGAFLSSFAVPGILLFLETADPGTPPCGYVYCTEDAANSANVEIDTCDCATGSITITLTDGPPNQFCYLMVSATNGLIEDPPGAEGDLCLAGGTIGRYIKDVGTIDASGTFATDVLNAQTGGGGGNIPTLGGNLCNPPGQTWNFQFWHRDGANPARFSKALEVTFQ